MIWSRWRSVDNAEVKPSPTQSWQPQWDPHGPRDRRPRLTARDLSCQQGPYGQPLCELTQNDLRSDRLGEDCHQFIQVRQFRRESEAGLDNNRNSPLQQFQRHRTNMTVSQINVENRPRDVTRLEQPLSFLDGRRGANHHASCILDANGEVQSDEGFILADEYSRAMKQNGTAGTGEALLDASASQTFQGSRQHD